MGKTKQFEFHEAANIFPLDEEHIDELAEDIKTNGQLCPIELLGGKILDGRRRYLACTRADVDPVFVEMSSVDVPDPVAYVLSLNLFRRHLTVSQASMCAARARDLLDKLAADAKERMLAGKKADPVPNCAQGSEDTGRTRDKLAEQFGVSHGSVGRAQQVIEKAIPEVTAAVDKGDITVNRGSQIAKSPEHIQKELLEVELGKKEKSRSPASKPEKEEVKPSKKKDGVGIVRANEAINALSRIPKNDPHRKRGFQIVSDWIRANK